MYISINQALDIWSELEQAYHKTNSYGGDTAEIYLYQVLPKNPSLEGLSASRLYDLLTDPRQSIMGEDAKEAYRAAHEALYQLFEKFSRKREAKVTIEDRPLGVWFKTAQYDHRIHVKVEPTPGSSWDGVTKPLFPDSFI